MSAYSLINTKWIALSAGLVVAASAPSAYAADFTLDFDKGANGSELLYNDNGTLVTTQWADFGLNDITGISNRQKDGKPRVAQFHAYDTDDFGGRDGDLSTGSQWGTASQGKVLIIQEELDQNKSNGKYIADDEAKGGKINFDFAQSIAFKSFSLLDIDDNGSGIRVKGFNDGETLIDIDIDALINDHFAANGNAQGSTFYRDGVTVTQVGSKRNDNSMYQFDLSQTYFENVRLRNVEFTYPGSGAIADLKWSTDDDTPQEIPEPSAVGSLLMLGFVGARKYLKRS